MKISLIIAGAIIAVLGTFLFNAYKKIKTTPMPDDNLKIKVLTVQNFDNQIKNGVILVDFWAPWCGPCKMMAPVLNSVAEELSGNASVGKLNVDQHQSIAAKYKVRSIPTLILFKNGKEINRFVGGRNKEFLIQVINQNK